MNFGRFRRESPTVNASSMADIAFLLLIFFLVTTTILVDKGIRVKLPPWSDDPFIGMTIPAKNVWSVKVNAKDELLVRGEYFDIKNLREKTKEFILNPNQRSNMPSSPKKAIVSFQNDRGTSYKIYLTIYNELKAAYNEIWEDEAQTRFGRTYKDLPTSLKREIRKDIPLVISEAEPSDYQLTEK